MTGTGSASSMRRAGAFRILAAAVVATGSVWGPAGAAPLRTFYVDPTGNDSAAGSATQPWRTLQKAANTVRAGDLVIVRAGHYAGLYLTTSGTAPDPITFHGEPGAIVDTQNPTTQDGINLEGASYVVIEGFTVTGVPRAGIRSVVNHHVIIRGNTGDLNGRWGILTGFSDDILIENNVMSRSQAEHGIYVSNSGDRPVIRRNIVFGNRANGIHMNGDVSQGGDGIISGALVEDNTIYDNGLGGGSGINCDGVQSSVFRNNLLYGNHASGISLYQIDAAQPARDNQVLNNTIVMATDARWAINIQNASTGNVLRNNILFNQQSFRGSVAISADSLSGFVSDTNVVMDRFSVDGGDTRIGLAAWRAATGQDQSSLIATPAALFVSFAGNDYHLSATSPAPDGDGHLLAAAGDDHGDPGRARQRQRHQRAPRHLLWHELLCELPVGQPGRAHGDGDGRFGLHGLVRRRLHGNEPLHGLARERDNDHRDLRAADGRARGDRHGRRNRHGDQRTGRPVVQHRVHRELCGGNLGRAHRDAGRRGRVRGMVGRLHRFRLLHGRAGSGSCGHGPLQPRLLGFDADSARERDPRAPRDRAADRDRHPAHPPGARGVRVDRLGHNHGRHRHQAEPSGRDALRRRRGLHRGRAPGAGADRRDDTTGRHDRPGRPHRRAPRRLSRPRVGRFP